MSCDQQIVETGFKPKSLAVLNHFLSASSKSRNVTIYSTTPLSNTFNSNGKGYVFSNYKDSSLSSHGTIINWWGFFFFFYLLHGN